MRYDYSGFSDTALIRQWWYVYLHSLQSQCWTRLGGMDELNAVTDAAEKRGIVKSGHAMPRTGAEDLAHQVDDWKLKQNAKTINRTKEHQ